MPVNNSTQQATSSHETGIFSWSNLLAVVLSIKNRLPEPWQDVIPVENVDDLKTAVKLVAVLTASFALAGIYDMLLLQEGGAL